MVEERKLDMFEEGYEYLMERASMNTEGRLSDEDFSSDIVDVLISLLEEDLK